MLPYRISLSSWDLEQDMRQEIMIRQHEVFLATGDQAASGHFGIARRVVRNQLKDRPDYYCGKSRSKSTMRKIIYDNESLKDVPAKAQTANAVAEFFNHIKQFLSAEQWNLLNEWLEGAKLKHLAVPGQRSITAVHKRIRHIVKIISRNVKMDEEALLKALKAYRRKK